MKKLGAWIKGHTTWLLVGAAAAGLTLLVILRHSSSSSSSSTGTVGQSGLLIPLQSDGTVSSGADATVGGGTAATPPPTITPPAPPGSLPPSAGGTCPPGFTLVSIPRSFAWMPNSVSRFFRQIGLAGGPILLCVPTGSGLLPPVGGAGGGAPGPGDLSSGATLLSGPGGTAKPLGTLAQRAVPGDLSGGTAPTSTTSPIISSFGRATGPPAIYPF